ncbi:MAG: amidohydrolase [Acidobacteria bacterium]|nr:amidohydrolase [Acidobacteriota bacterium]
MKTLAALVLAASALQGENIAITNARIWTGDPARPWVQALLTDGNRIAAVGTDLDIARRRIQGVRFIDAGGRLVVPGFNDAHVHLLSGSLGMSNIDLTGICTLPAMQAKIAEYAKAHPEKAWITGRGWEYYCFPGQRLPTKEDIDAVVKDRPVFLSAYDGHTGWVNSKALERADINRATRFSGYGEIVKDAAGNPTGSLKEGAQGLVRRLIPVTTRAEKLAALRNGMKLAARLGITSIQNASGDEDELSLYDELQRAGELTLRVAMAFSVAPGAPLARAVEIAKVKAAHKHPLVQVCGVKFGMDGVIENYSAAMIEPYSDKPGERGSTAWTAAQFHAMVAACDRNGLQIYTHAIGDRGVRMTLDGYEHALQTNGHHDARFRIEHIETVHPTDIPRFAKLGVLASMEPIHADPDGVNVWSKCVGEARLPMAFAWRSLEKAGARLVFSSDWPASISVDPIRGLHNAVNRRTTEGKPEGGWIPEQKVSMDTALRGYTTQAAYASFDERTKGRLQPGMLADLLILSQDVFQIPPMDVHKTKVDVTIFDGRVIFNR